MAYRLRVEASLDWVPDGGDQIGFVGPGLSNNPGYTAALSAGAVGAAQTMLLMVAEFVGGGDTLTQGNLNTALTNAATDLGTLFGTTGAWGGNPNQTPTAIATAWATGGE